MSVRNRRLDYFLLGLLHLYYDFAHPFRLGTAAFFKKSEMFRIISSPLCLLPTLPLYVLIFLLLFSPVRLLLCRFFLCPLLVLHLLCGGAFFLQSLLPRALFFLCFGQFSPLFGLREPA
ncbi:MAG: hypothetical protein ABJN75_22850 [Hoeflea sp.]|uniref:hypothetical protein n=1 Tax=Hoeflea sp. TaxID=1940281 RepID=UPI003297A7C9